MTDHPNASTDYRALRMELHEAELALRDQRERVAALRRKLPRNTPTGDTTFEELRDGAVVPVRLSELFREPTRPLVLMHFMFGKAQKQPCPMCTLWADGYAGAAPALAQRVNFAVLVAGEIERFDAYARERGWRGLRLVSAGESTLKRELGFEDEAGAQLPGVSIFERQPSGALTHFYSVTAVAAEGARMMDLLSPVWHFLDLTPDGRGDWMPSLAG